MEIVIRAAHPGDLGPLADIELDGFETLRMAGAVPDEPATASGDELRHWLDDGVLLVAAEITERPVGFGSALAAGDLLHICELDVARAFQRRGIGRRLMCALIDVARTQGFRGATLTTDRLAPFNARFYETLGFRVLEQTELDDRLRRILETESISGLDPARRCAMRLNF
jgi:GNAT superfamily N-acetyltransferase